MTKIERKLGDGDELLEIFLAVAVAKIFVVHEILVRPRCIMESDNGSSSGTQIVTICNFSGFDVFRLERIRLMIT